MSGNHKLNIPNDLLEDLCSRFLVNVPEEEKNDMIRLCFQIELAHWFYLDFFRASDASLPDCKMRDFTKLIFREFPWLLNPPNINVDVVLESWKEYKRNVPTYGAILLDSKLENLLLVQGFWIKSSWGFPKGKVNKGESGDVCAAREVLEETGYDISDKIDKSQYAEHNLNEQLCRLYFVPNVPKTVSFKPKTRGEIKDLQWFNVNDLPCHKKDLTPKINLDLPPTSFFMVIPFVKQIRKWISCKKRQLNFRPNSSGNYTRNRDSPNAGTNNTSMHRSTSTDSFHHNRHLDINHDHFPHHKIKQAQVQQSAEQFAQGNNTELEMIHRLSMDPKDANYIPSPQKKKRGDVGDHRKKGHNTAHGQQHNNHNHDGNGAFARGRRLKTDHTDAPTAWKNFRFDRDALMKAIKNLQ